MTSEDNNILEDHDLSLFQEPEGFRPRSPEPTFQVFERQPEHVEPGTLDRLTVRLVGSHPLWGHYLWNAAKCLSWYLDEHKELVRGNNVLELGAGAALPSFVAMLNGAEKVVITDYPDNILMQNIEYNLSNIFSNSQEREKFAVMGHIWGKDTRPLLNLISSNSSQSSDFVSPLFDLIILSDLIFNHSQHNALLSTCQSCLSPSGVALVFYTHHKPHLAHKDMNFFELAQKEFDFRVEKIYERRMTPMFEKDYGDVNDRATVH
ncbi:4838_t:CDS:2, partial [Paraglomus occultum]